MVGLSKLVSNTLCSLLTNFVADDGDGVFLLDLIGDDESETVKGDDISFSLSLLDFFLHFVILHDSKIELDSEATEA